MTRVGRATWGHSAVIPCRGPRRTFVNGKVREASREGSRPCLVAMALKSRKPGWRGVATPTLQDLCSISAASRLRPGVIDAACSRIQLRNAPQRQRLLLDWPRELLRDF